MASTSVPRWSRTPPPAGRDGVAYTVLTVGRAAQQTGRAWELELAGRPVRVLHAEHFADEVLAEFRSQIEDAFVGWRLLISAPEAELALLRAAAIAGGVIDAEITEHLSDVGQRRVRCAHCASIVKTDAPVGATARCAGCGASLVVYHHFSRRLACYLGFSSDAETAGPTR